MLWLLIGLAGVAILVIAWHMMTPVSWHFLSSAQITDLKGVLFSGGVGAFIAKYFERQVS